MRVLVPSLLVVILLLSSLGVFGIDIPVSTQVNILPGINDSNNTTSNNSEVGGSSTTPSSASPHLIAGRHSTDK